MPQANTAKNFYERNGVWYYLLYVNGQRTRKSTKCTTLDEAKKWVDERYPKKKIAREVEPFSTKPFKVTTKFISDMHYRMKSRFPGKPVMPRKDLALLFAMADGKCQMTGIPFVGHSVDDDKSRKPFMPSIDRIDSRKYYTLDNCRIVCLAINLAMNEWGQEVFDLISYNRIKHRLDSL